VYLSDSRSTFNVQNITAIPGGGSTQFVYPSPVTTTRIDLDGSPLDVTTIYDTYGDGWGNVTHKTTSVTDSVHGPLYQSVIDTTYQNPSPSGPWVGGLPTKITEVRSGTDRVNSAPRVVSHTYDPATGLVATDTQSPTVASYAFTNTYDRTGNKFGLVNKITQSWVDPATGTATTRLTRDVDYDALGRFELTQRNALGKPVTQTFFGSTGMRHTFNDLNGLLTVFWSDGFGRPTRELTPESDASSHSYKQCDGTCPTNAVMAEITDTFNGSSRIEVPSVVYRDSLGHVVQKATWGYDGTPIVQDTHYDAFGRVYETMQPRFASDVARLGERHGYDDLSRVTSVTTLRESGVEVKATTTFQGLTRVLKNAKGQQRTELRDLLGRVVKVTNATAQGDVVTLFDYTQFGDLAKTTDPNGNVITVTYDDYGRKTDLRDPDLGWLHYDVDPVGRPWRHVSPIQRAAGTNTHSSFDALDRVTATYETDLESHWIFDSATKGVGKLAEAYTGTPAAKDYRRVETYDSLARPSTTSIILGGVTYKETRAYDAWGRLSSTSEQRGTDAAKSFGRRYNGQGYLAAITHNGIDLWTQTTADAALRSLTAQLGNGLIETAHFSPYSGRLDDVLGQVGTAGVKRFHEHDTFDELGNVLVRSGEYNYLQGDASAYKDTFNYDDLNRLTSDQEWTNAPKNFSYDAAGNLRTKNDPSASPAVTATYAYPAQGSSAIRPHAVQSITGWTGTFQYDANGNELSSPTGLSMTWTSFDMPIKVSKLAGGVTNYDTFVYGPEHQRSKMTSGQGAAVSSITYYAGAMEVQTDGGGVLLQVKTYWPEGLGVDIDKPSAATQMLWHHADRLGSVMALTDATGALVERLNYDAWGKRRYPSGIDADDAIVGKLDDKGFTGQQMLDSVDLVHLNGRIYDPFVGRFVSADPFVQDPHNGQSYNRFSYVLNNPTNLTDPTGFAAGGENLAPNKPEKVPECDSTCQQIKNRIRDALRAGRPVVVTDENGNVIEVVSPGDLQNSGAGSSSQRTNLKSIVKIDDQTVPEWSKSVTIRTFNPEGHWNTCSPSAACTALWNAQVQKESLGNFDKEIATALVPVGRLIALAKFGGAVKATETVWDSIKATQPVWPGTTIPRSFELATGNGSVWVHGNATEHLAEYATSMANRGVSSDMVRIATQQQLRSLQAAVTRASVDGPSYGKLMVQGGWELKFAAPRSGGQLPALIHALPTE